MQLEGDTLFFKRSAELSDEVAQQGGVCGIENPMAPGKDPFPSMFNTPQAQMLRER